MALDHFNLSRPPFSALPDPAFHYEDAARRELLGALQYALRLGDGVIKVTGEPGSGKTMLCAVLAARLAQASPPVQTIMLSRPSNAAGIALSPQDAVCAIARQLGLDPGGLRSDEIMRLLHTHLAGERAAGRQAVLLVEESQALPADTLETLRQLTNLNEGTHNLLPVVLLGTPELSNVLRQPRLRQLRERITLSFVLPALPPELVPELLAHRLRAAGHADGALFQLDAAKLVARSAGNDLHAMIALAGKALTVAANASAPAVAMFHVRDAIKGISIQPLPPAADTSPARIAETSAPPELAAEPEPEAVVEVSQTEGAEAGPMGQAEPDLTLKAAPEPTDAPEPAVAVEAAGAVEAVEAEAVAAAVASEATQTAAAELEPSLPAAEPELEPPQPAAPVLTPELPGPAVRPQRSVARSAVIAGGAMLAVAGVATAAFMLRPAASPASLAAPAPVKPAVAQARPPVQMALPAAEPPKPEPSEQAAAPAPATAAPKEAASLASPAAAPTAAPEAPPAPVAARKPSLLKQSLQASKTWLRDEPDNNFCVQMENFPASDPARAEKFLADTRTAMGLRDVHSYPMLINGERRIAIVYGSFASAKKVLEVQASLAERSGAHHKIRTIKGIRQAIAKAEGKK